LLRCIYKTLGAVFPHVAFLPGNTVHFFASNRPGQLVTSAGGLLERLRARGIQTTYVREYYIPFRMMPDRMTSLAAEIRPRADTPVNRDSRPSPTTSTRCCGANALDGAGGWSHSATQRFSVQSRWL